MAIKSLNEVINGHGSYYTTDGHDLWQQIGYIDQPIVILENVRTKEKEHLVIGCLNAEAFVKLEPVQAIKPVSEDTSQEGCSG